LDRRGIAASTSIVAAVAVVSLGARELWPGDAINAARRQSDRSPRAATVAGAALLNAQIKQYALPLTTINTGFVEWVVSRTPRSACYRLVGPHGDVEQWIGYRMLPRLAAAGSAQGCWLIFYRARPRQAGYTPDALRDAIVYAPGFSLARLVGARGTG
jgi:hypothetical protein